MGHDVGVTEVWVTEGGGTFVQGLIRLLSTCANGSAAAAESLLLLRISSILKDVLAGSGLISSTSVSASSVNRPPEQACVFGAIGVKGTLWGCIFCIGCTMQLSGDIKMLAVVVPALVCWPVLL